VSNQKKDALPPGREIGLSPGTVPLYTWSDIDARGGPPRRNERNTDRKRRLERMAKKLYVGNIHFKATEEKLRDLFAGIGEVASINVIKDKRTGKNKGMAFVEMASDEEAQKAMEALNGTPLLDRPLSVTEAHTQEPRERRDLDEGNAGQGRTGD
jgi:RNA recognition motif-containing protein